MSKSGKNLENLSENEIIENEQIKLNKKSNKRNNSKSNNAKQEEVITEPEVVDVTKILLQGTTIYCREKEREQIIQFIKESKNKTIYVCGQPGTGKTSLINQILSSFKEIDLSLQFYFNCMCFKNANDFYSNFFDQMKKLYHIIEKQFSKAEMNKFEKLISTALKTKSTTEESKGVTLDVIGLFKNKFTPYIFFINKQCRIIILDEIDYVYQKYYSIIFFDILKLPYLTETNMKYISK